MEPNSVEQHNDTRCEYEITEKKVIFYEIYSWWVKGVLSLCVSFMGIVFNTISIFILCNKKMNHSFFNRLLVCLAMVDSVFLATGIYVALVMQVVESLSNSYDPQLIFITILYPARNILMSTSIYMTIGLAYERFTSITKPYLYRARETTNKCHRLLTYVAPVFIISVIYNINIPSQYNGLKKYIKFTIFVH